MNFERFEPALRFLDGAPFHRSRRWRLAWAAVGIIAISFIIYAHAVVVDGLFWQDSHTLNAVASLFSLSHFWTRGSGSYRPLTLTLLWIERRGFGGYALPYHVVAALIHATNGVLLWWILRRLGVPGAWLAAALFAAHPVQVQSVAWLTQQPLLICPFFCLLSVWLYLRWLQIRPPIPKKLAGLEPPGPPPPRIRYVMSLGACVAAVLSGPLGISLPVVLLLLVWWKRGALPRSQWTQLSPFFAVAFCGLIANVFLHRSSLDPLGPAPTLSALQRVMIAGHAIGYYAIELVRLYPADLIHPRWDLSRVAANGMWIVLIVIGGLTAWLGRRLWGGAPLLVVLVFIALTLPNVVTTLSQRAPAIYVADAQQYLAFAVPMALLAAALVALTDRSSTLVPLRASRAAVGIISIGLFATFAVLQTLTFRSAETGLQAAVSRDPTNGVARAQYAMLLLDENPRSALKVLDDAGRSATVDLALLDARGHVCLALGQYDEAIRSYLLAQRLAPDHPLIPLDLAAAYDAAGTAAADQGRRVEAFDNYNDALAACQAAQQLDPNEPLADDRTGTVLFHEGRIPESLDRFDAAIFKDSACVSARVHKAEALFNAGLQGDADQLAAASAELTEALRIDPTNAEAFCAAANMQFRRKNFAAAELEYRSAIRLNPGSAEAWTDLGFAQSAQNRFGEAVQSFERALSIRADAPDALRGKRLAQVQLARGNQKS